MIKSYVIAAWRNIVRHKLFATINIIGLAISISVGLVIVSLVSDLRSYDNFHKNANRTYRIVTTQTTQGIEPEDYASSSVKTGKLIRESVAGVKEVTIVRKGVGGDISVGEKTVSIGTMYADNSFFNVFDFERPGVPWPFLFGTAGGSPAHEREARVTDSHLRCSWQASRLRSQ